MPAPLGGGRLTFHDTGEAKILGVRLQPSKLKAVILQQPKFEPDELKREEKSLHLIDAI